MTKHIGETWTNSVGDKATIVQYVKYNEVYVQFEGYKETVCYRYNNLKNGQFKNPFAPLIYGVGYIGVGKYVTKINGKRTRYYEVWVSMIRRCYSGESRFSAWHDCIVEDEWHNFQTFAKWYEENYYEVDNDVMCLDKDILNKGNKVYSSKTCCFVPNRVNTLLINCRNARGDLLLGVHMQDDYYIVQCCNDGKQEYVGLYYSKNDAFKAYKVYKENIIKNVARRYKDIIPQKVYDALMSWQIEISD